MSENIKSGTINRPTFIFHADTVLLPATWAQIHIQDAQNLKRALENSNGQAVFAYQKEGTKELYEIATIGTVKIHQVAPDGSARVTLTATGRVRLNDTTLEQNPGNGFIEMAATPVACGEATPAQYEMVQELYEKIEELVKKTSDSIVMNFGSQAAKQRTVDILGYLDKKKSVPAAFVDAAARALLYDEFINPLCHWMPGLLQKTEPEEQLEFLLKEVSAMTATLDKKEEYFNAVSKGGQEMDDMQELEEKIRKSGMSDEARAKCEKELKKLARMNPQDPSRNKPMEYIEEILSLPWKKSPAENINLQQAEDILNEDHYGLDDVKEKIIEQIAVQLHTGKVNGSIMCLAGPPGVGKTSIGKSLARATGRKFSRVSLGGVHEESAIRGHRITYVSAKPGRIIDAMKEAGATNPIIMLDEIDKLGKGGGNGDPTAALLEVLDPAQNGTFVDHYLDIKYDLSDVMFVATANDLGNIPEPLRDRMYIIQIEGYTNEEKKEIANRYLVKNVMEKDKLSDATFSITDEAISALIDGYTREAGVRSLEQEISNLAGKAVVQLLKGAESVKITPDNLEDYAGPKKYEHETVDPEPEVGQVNGLYVSGMGGGVLPFEAVKIADPRGGAAATGSLRDVMKESVSNAYDFVRANAGELGIEPATYQQNFVSIKAGDGATPKDGPSAGLAITTLIVSALTGIPIRGDVAMTGEVGLKGKAMPIGGLKQKLIGAHRAGIKTVLIPEANKKDLAKVPESIKRDLEIIPVSNAWQVLENALVTMPKSLTAEQAKTQEAAPQNELREQVVSVLAELFSQAATPAQQTPANDLHPPKPDVRQKVRQQRQP